MGIRSALVVDDSRSARYILQRLLERRHIQVDVADSAQQAFDYLRTHRPDVVFMDDMMPGMDGQEAVDRLGADPRTAGIPIVMYTGREYATEASLPPRRGVVGVLSKPFTQADVNALLARLGVQAAPPRVEPARLVRMSEPPPRASVPATPVSAERTPPRMQSLDRLRSQLAEELKAEARLAVEQLLGEELESRVDAQIERHTRVWHQALEQTRKEHARAQSQLLDDRLPRLLELLEQRIEKHIDTRVDERLQAFAATFEARADAPTGADALSPLQRAQVAHIVQTEAVNLVDRPARQSARRVAAELMRTDVNAVNVRLDRLRRRFNSLIIAAAVAVIAAGVAGYLAGVMN